MSDAPPLFIFEHIANEMERKIASGEYAPGSRLPTDAEQAEQYGVNPLTVRKAMEILRKRGLVIRQQRRGSFVAKPKAETTASVVYIGNCEGHMFRNLFVALQGAVQRHGGRLSGYHCEHDIKEPVVPDLQGFLEGASAAVVDLVHAGKALVQIASTVKRVVGLETGIAEAQTPVSVVLDHYAAIELALDHLIKHGHRRIGFITWGMPDDRVANPVDIVDVHFQRLVNAKLRRFEYLMTGRGLLENMSAFCMLNEQPDSSQRRLASYLQDANAPTAVICDGDFRAQAVYLSAAHVGLAVPEKLSVVGIGDTPWTRQLAPELTSVNMGEEAAADLAARLCLGQEPVTQLRCKIVPHLVTRASVAELRPGAEISG